MSADQNDATKLCDGGTPQQVIVTSDGGTPEHFLITLDCGWMQTIIARCDYDHHASGVAQTVALALDCDVEWIANVASDDGRRNA